MTDSPELEDPAGIVLLGDHEVDAAVLEALCTDFESAGLRVVALNAAEFATDREATVGIEAAFTSLLSDLPGRRRVGILGLGESGEIALLVGCTSRKVGFVVSAFGPLVRSELDEARPSQPLELTLNLDAPFLLFRGRSDSRVPDEHVELLRTKMDAFFRSYEVIERDGSGMEALRVQSLGYNAQVAAETQAEIVRCTVPFIVDALD